jgi:DNA-binding NtrC family response regulator
VAALKRGAYDYITKPFSGDELLVAVARAIEHRRLVRENQVLRAAASPAGSPASSDAHQIVGDGHVMTELLARLHQIADSHSTVFVSGESGAGKEVAARRIHAASPRADQPFLAINCAALSTSLLESELFGHEKGAFTGADKLRRGRFELADGGTLLLDEISEIAPPVQAKLLRVLQEQSFERVGSSRSLAVDVRVIATTNRNLETEVARGTFRQDLFFRLNVLPLAMPPLRAHLEDLPGLTTHFLGRVAAREGKPAKSFTPEAMALLGRYAWPGNVRELQNVCERAAVLTQGDVIEATLVAPWLNVPFVAAPVVQAASTVEAKPHASEHVSGGAPAQLPAQLGVVCDGTVTLHDLERESIVATLEAHNGHRQRSARALGIGVRTLGLKLKKWKEQKVVAPDL